ncbi:hypothetical protein P7K49_007118 [Saguinus oedipus]|uniref:Uncharacterized protein n=1 Tax=Saguinus oedipus TaxID=9490 RepID=A0ABQ9VXI6_SAGOE|nr:hypothetical protein P7K49_007118 [Saguinus oedipus]
MVDPIPCSPTTIAADNVNGTLESFCYVPVVIREVARVLGFCAESQVENVVDEHEVDVLEQSVYRKQDIKRIAETQCIGPGLPSPFGPLHSMEGGSRLSGQPGAASPRHISSVT